MIKPGDIDSPTAQSVWREMPIVHKPLMASLSLTFLTPPILVWLGGMMMKERVVEPT